MLTTHERLFIQKTVHIYLNKAENTFKHSAVKLDKPETHEEVTTLPYIDSTTSGVEFQNKTIIFAIL